LTQSNTLSVDTRWHNLLAAALSNLWDLSFASVSSVKWFLSFDEFRSMKRRWQQRMGGMVGDDGGKWKTLLH
jgi:hypothetical protein